MISDIDLKDWGNGAPQFPRTSAGAMDSSFVGREPNLRERSRSRHFTRSRVAATSRKNAPERAAR